MDSLVKTAKDYDMKINSKKTKIMMISKDMSGKISICVDGQKIERVSHFKYLGSVVSEDGRSVAAIKEGIMLPKDAFGRRRELLIRHMSRTLKKKMIKHSYGL